MRDVIGKPDGGATDGDRITPIGEHHHSDTIEAPTPVGWDDDREATLPPPSGVRQCQWQHVTTNGDVI